MRPPAALDSLTALALEGRRLLADLLLLVELGQRAPPARARLARADLAQLGGVGHLDGLLALGLGHADLAQLLLLGHVDLGLLHRLRRRLAADGLDVARLVGDVGDVDVDQHQADLLQLRLQRLLNVLQELVAVAVDVLDPHRGDDLAQLAEDDVAGLLLDLLGAQAEQADGGVLHRLRVGADGDGEDAGHVDADVLDRQRALERDLDLDRLQAEVGVVLDQRPDEGGAAVDAARPRCRRRSCRR